MKRGKIVRSAIHHQQIKIREGTYEQSLFTEEDGKPVVKLREKAKPLKKRTGAKISAWKFE